MKFFLPATLLAFVSIAQAVPVAPSRSIFRRQDLSEQLSALDEQICALRQQKCELEGAATQKAIDDNFNKFESAAFAGPKSNPVLLEGDKFVTNGLPFDTAEAAIAQSCVDQKVACNSLKDDPNISPDSFLPSPDQCDLQETLCLAQDDSGRALNFKNPVACRVNFESCVERGPDN